LQKQQEILALLTQRNQQEYLLLVNLVSKFAKTADRERGMPKPVEVRAEKE
jgi:hypothetical protein